MTARDWRAPLGELLPERFNLGSHCCDRLVEEGLGERPAIRHDDGATSFAELRDLSNRIGNGLRAAGVGEREHFLIRLPNTVVAYATFLAGLKIGAVPVPTTPLLRERDLAQIVERARVRLAVTDESLAAPVRALASAGGPLREVVCVGAAEGGDLAAGQPTALTVADTGPEDPAFVLFTSGTTGTPKGIAHAHRAFNVAVGNPCARVGMALQPDDVVLQPADFAWSYTLGCGLLHPLDVGASTVVSTGRIRPEQILPLIERHGVTILAAVPTLFRAVLALPEAERRHDLSSLRFCMSAGELLPPTLYDAWKELTGVETYEHIGQAELQMLVADLPGPPPKRGSLGKPLPGYEVAVLDEQGERCGPGTVGQLALRDDNPALFYEYLEMPEKFEANHRDGWYLTGDLARVDEDGDYWFVSRADDLIKSRGYSISPAEVEATLSEHPAVREAAVVGVPHPDLGVAVKAFVVVDGDAHPDLAEQLREYVKSRVAPYKAPREVEFVAELPKTTTGKLARGALRNVPA